MIKSGLEQGLHELQGPLVLEDREELGHRQCRTISMVNGESTGCLPRFCFCYHQPPVASLPIISVSPAGAWRQRL